MHNDRHDQTTRFPPPDYGDPKREFGEDYKRFTLCCECIHLARTESMETITVDDCELVVCPACYEVMK